MRPFKVTSPRARTSSVSVDDVAVAPRAGVPAGILRLAAPRADLTASLHQDVRLLDERGRLSPGDQHARRRRIAAFFLVQELVGDDQDTIARLIVADRDRGDDPRRVDRLQEREVARRPFADGRQLLEEARQILRERADLLLLALQGDERALLARLEIEDALAGRAEGAGREVVRSDEFERRAHLPPSQPRLPSTEFTVSTTGPWRWYPIAVTEHGAIMMRWKRSRWMPSA